MAQTLLAWLSSQNKALVKISDFSRQRNYFYLFSIFLSTIYHLDQIHLTKNFQTFSDEYMHDHSSAVKVSAHET